VLQLAELDVRREGRAIVIARRPTTTQRNRYEHDPQGETYHPIGGGLRTATFRPKVTGLDELRGREEEFERGTGLNSVTTVHEDGAWTS
jgi:hypothetical protein